MTNEPDEPAALARARTAYEHAESKQRTAWRIFRAASWPYQDAHAEWNAWQNAKAWAEFAKKSYARVRRDHGETSS